MGGFAIDVEEDEKTNAASFFTSVHTETGCHGIVNRFKRSLEVSSKNKVSQRVFRSFQAIRNERLRQRQENIFIIHPLSQFRWYWDLIMVTTLVTTLLLLPVEVAFYSDDEGHTSLTWMSINIVVDVVFLIDIAFNFRTGFVNTEVDQVEINSRLVALNYLKTWFVIDLVSSIPLDYIYQLATASAGSDAVTSHSIYLTFKILKFTKFLSLLRIFRVARLVRYMYKIEELLEMEGRVISMVNLVLIIFVFCHWNGCLQYISAYLEGYPEDSWVVNSGLVNITGNTTNRIATPWTMYTKSLWRAMSHMLSIGYGTKPPITNTDTWMVIISMILGATFYALFIGSMSSLILTLDLSGKKYDEMIAEIKQYMRFRRVPIEIQRRVLEYYDHKYQRKYFNETSILYDATALSHTLRQDILMHNCRSLVAKVPFLSSAPSDFLFDIIRKLDFQVFFPQDIIVQAGKKGDSMYFIEHGLVDIKLSNGRVISHLGDGSYFGEISLLLEQRRIATVVAVEICDMYCLKKADFDDVLQEYPEMKMILRRIAVQRMSQISDNQERITRIPHAALITNDLPSTSEDLGGLADSDLTLLSNDVVSDVSAGIKPLTKAAPEGKTPKDSRSKESEIKPETNEKEKSLSGKSGKGTVNKSEKEPEKTGKDSEKSETVKSGQETEKETKTSGKENVKTESVEDKKAAQKSKTTESVNKKK